MDYGDAERGLSLHDALVKFLPALLFEFLGDFLLDENYADDLVPLEALEPHPLQHPVLVLL